MSRESRLAALRARRHAMLVANSYDDHPAPAAPVADYDPSLGLPTQVAREAPPPIPVPPMLRGVYQRCGRCESYMRAGVCAYCSKMTA